MCGDPILTVESSEKEDDDDDDEEEEEEEEDGADEDEDEDEDDDDEDEDDAIVLFVMSRWLLPVTVPCSSLLLLRVWLKYGSWALALSVIVVNSSKLFPAEGAAEEFEKEEEEEEDNEDCNSGINLEVELGGSGRRTGERIIIDPLGHLLRLSVPSD